MERTNRDRDCPMVNTAASRTKGHRFDFLVRHDMHWISCKQRFQRQIRPGQKSSEIAALDERKVAAASL